jgi:hypothetical protein
LYLTSTSWCVGLLACIKCLQYDFVMSYMGIIMSSLRCCILRASVQSTSHPVNYNTQILGKYISSQVVLIIKHQNLLSQMARGPFSLQSPLFGDWWQHNQCKQILQTFEYKYTIYLLGCMFLPIMWDYGLKPPPNSIINLLPILDQNAQTTWKIKILIWWCLVFDIIFITLVPTTSPLWHQPPKRKTLKAYRKQIRLALSKELSININRSTKRLLPLNECSPLKRIFSPFRGEEKLPLTEIFYLGKSTWEIEVQDIIWID